MLIVVGVSLIDVLLVSFLVLTVQRRQLVDSTQSAIIRLSDTVEAGFLHAMIENDWSLVDQMVEGVVAEESIERIRILDAQGVVRISSDSEEVGDRFDRDKLLVRYSSGEKRTVRLSESKASVPVSPRPGN